MKLNKLLIVILLAVTSYLNSMLRVPQASANLTKYIPALKFNSALKQPISLNNGIFKSTRPLMVQYNYSENPYKVLNLPINSKPTAEEIKKAYRNIALKKHPDAGGTKEEFQKVQDAYEYLDYLRKNNYSNNSYSNNSYSDDSNYTDPTVEKLAKIIFKFCAGLFVLSVTTTKYFSYYDRKATNEHKLKTTNKNIVAQIAC